MIFNAVIWGVLFVLVFAFWFFSHELTIFQGLLLLILLNGFAIISKRLSQVGGYENDPGHR